MTVYLVGAGPGDPDLITVRGAKLLERCSAVVFDRLASTQLLDLAPEDATRHNVGKNPRGSSVSQQDINELLVELGQVHDVVVRLKGGDPFVFARGAEEIDALVEGGVPYEVVPGISSALAVPAFGGIPVTKRFTSTSFTVVTGHEDPTKALPDVNWDALAAVGNTIVILMGVSRISSISQRLIEAGRDPNTPVAAIRWGSRPEQSTIISTLDNISDCELSPPTVFVVGNVVSNTYRWFENRPLFGCTVAITRPRNSQSRLSVMLEEQGAVVHNVSAIEMVDPPSGTAELEHTVLNIEQYEWVVLSSPYAASQFFRFCSDVRTLHHTKIAVIGPGTADVVRTHGIQADLVPKRYVAEGLLDTFPAPTPESRSVLIPQSQLARPLLRTGLEAMGYNVVSPVSYHTIASHLDDQQLQHLTDTNIVAFASSSAATSFSAGVPRNSWPQHVAAIGPQTAATARELGFESVTVADQHDLTGLANAIRDIYHSIRDN